MPLLLTDFEHALIGFAAKEYMLNVSNNNNISTLSVSARKTEAYLEPCQTSVVEFSLKDIQRLKAVNYFL